MDAAGRVNVFLLVVVCDNIQVGQNKEAQFTTNFRPPINVPPGLLVSVKSSGGGVPSRFLSIRWTFDKRKMWIAIRSPVAVRLLNVQR